ncbi:MAG TPA: rod shape-determining protein MreD, partial [Anaerolineae bacterium]|nr:rod shape-determining protein MreD [Anaerolineae bacterium]
MKIIRNILLIALALLLQSVLIGRLDMYGIRPDLSMIVLIFLANESRPVEIIIYGFFIGFIQDVYTPEYLGYNAFSMSLIAYFLSMMK